MSCAGNNILHQVCLTGDLPLAGIIPQNSVDINHQNKEGQTPLHLAILKGDLSLFKFLLSLGPDLTALNRDSESYLEISLTHFSPAVCRALLDVWPHQLQLYQPENKESWLHFTAKNGMLEQTELLLQSGHHVEARDANLQSPLHYAVLFNQVR